MSLFYFFGGDGTDRAGLGGGDIPRRWFPAPSSAPEMATQHRQQGRPCGDDRNGGKCWGVQCLYVAYATFLYACTFNLEYTIDLYV